MPTYNFVNTKTNEEFESFMRMSELDQYLLDNPDIQQMPSPINLHSGIGLGLRKTSDGFNDLLKSKKSFYGKGNTINTR